MAFKGSQSAISMMEFTSSPMVANGPIMLDMQAIRTQDALQPGRTDLSIGLRCEYSSWCMCEPMVDPQVENASSSSAPLTISHYRDVRSRHVRLT